MQTKITKHSSFLTLLYIHIYKTKMMSRSYKYKLNKIDIFKTFLRLQMFL